MGGSLPNRSWAAIAAALRKVPRAGLIRLLRDLYDAHPPVRTFLEGRLEVGPMGHGLEAAFSQAGQELESILQSAEVRGSPPFAAAREVIDGYRKASLDEAGTARLMITVAAWSLRRLADGAGPELARPLRSWLRTLDGRLRTPDLRDALPDMAPALRELAALSGRCADGLADTIPAWVEEVLAGVPESPAAGRRRGRFDGDPDFDSV
ncbi:MAG: hypothetical protein ACK4PI_03530 [Tepidisphaerales bacterium]